MEISLDLVKKLREKTGAGITDSKKALIESNGDIEKAIEYLRKKGAATSKKRSDRIAKEGIVIAKSSEDRKEAAIVEINCETDFVAKSDAFVKLADKIVSEVLAYKGNEISQFLPVVQGIIDETTASVGEKIDFKRMSYLKTDDGYFSVYNHLGNKIASVVELSGSPDETGINLGNDIAMQVVALKPIVVSRNEISDDMIQKEKEIYKIQAINEGKNESIAEKIASNRVEKFFEENCLVDQEFVKEPGKSVTEILKEASQKNGSEYKIKRFIRYQLGETLES
ncbi:MAG: translation elongation factor Ts [Ignavibacteria bacterium]|nr:translation elongation factor Ts [Ignavibacteria bacterium]